MSIDRSCSRCVFYALHVYGRSPHCGVAPRLVQ